MKGGRILLLLAFLAAGSAVAALPALVLVQEAFTFASGLVIRQVGKEVVMSAGVAANDAAWASGTGGLLANVAAFIGLGAYVSDVGVEEYVVPTRPGVDLPQWKPSTALGAQGSYNNPFPSTFNGVRYKPDRVYWIDGLHSIDGFRHDWPGGEFASPQAFCDAWNAFVAQYTQPEWVNKLRPIARPELDPWDVLFNGQYYYVQRFSTEYYEGPPNDIGGSGPDALPRLVEATDGVKRFKLITGGIVADETDPDWSQTDLERLSSPGRLVWRGTATDGQAARVDLSYDESKEFKIGSITQEPDAVKYRELALNPSTSAIQVVSEQVIKNADVGTFYEANPQYGPGQGTQTGTWPDDYARQATLLSVNTQLATANTNLSSINRALTEPGTPATGPTLPDASLFTDQFFKDTFSPLLAWQLPLHTSQCPTSSFAAFGALYTVNAHCQLIQDHWGALSAVMTAVWSVLALFLVLKA